MIDRRRSKRRELLIFLPAYDKESSELLGYIADINHGGLMLFSEKYLEVGKKYTLKVCVEDLRAALILRPDEGHEGCCLEWTARSRWIAIHPELYRIGFMFMEMTPQTQSTLDQVIAHLDALAGAADRPTAPMNACPKYPSQDITT
ncbi:MAG: hypothetical protein RIT27_1400 [Pseudomonadota bacterium]|jgi:hypothetical protein